MYERSWLTSILAKFFVRRYADQNKLAAAPDLPAEVVAALKAYDWPGNVRELENAVERLIVLSDNGHLSAEHLRPPRARLPLRGGAGGPGGDVAGLIRALVRAGVQAPLPAGEKLYHFLVGGLERELIEQVLRQCDGVQIKAADRLGINRNTLHKKLEEFAAGDAAAAPDPPRPEAAAG